jgi:hypothetical protein
VHALWVRLLKEPGRNIPATTNTQSQASQPASPALLHRQRVCCSILALNLPPSWLCCCYALLALVLLLVAVGLDQLL